MIYLNQRHNTDKLNSTQNYAILEISFTEVHSILLFNNRYDCQKEWEEFVKGKHECNICFDEKSGSEFFRISECLHHFCRECMTEYCSMHVSDGTVHQLT